MDDKGDEGEDLSGKNKYLTEDIIDDDCTSGGYYDAGDYVKFGFPLAFSLTLLSWGGLEFTAGYEDAGVMDDLEDVVR